VPLERVRVDCLRCLKEVEVRLQGEQNYLYGPNGAGKTSFLEALYLLSRGRSFRTRQTRRLVQRGSAGLVVYGEVDREGGALTRIGVRVDHAGLGVSIDREAAGLAELAAVLRADVIDPSVHRLVEGGPSERRRFLDWGVFHVEHSYLEIWQRYRRLLGQRNAALQRGGGAIAELKVWTEAVAAAGEQVDGFRRSYLERLEPYVTAHAAALLGQAISVEYRRGWRADLDLASALDASVGRDRAVGHTEAGPHRADLVLNIAGHRVQDEASRGQQKLVAVALVLAQESVVSALAPARSLLLVDDPAAELDRAAFDRLLDGLARIRSQLFFTGLAPLALNNGAAPRVFHVERGHVHAL
jgi:DNA replication and repair protein RecF